MQAKHTFFKILGSYARLAENLNEKWRRLEKACCMENFRGLLEMENRPPANTLKDH